MNQQTRDTSLMKLEPCSSLFNVMKCNGVRVMPYFALGLSLSEIIPTDKPSLPNGNCPLKKVRLSG